VGSTEALVAQLAALQAAGGGYDNITLNVRRGAAHSMRLATPGTSAIITRNVRLQTATHDQPASGSSAAPLMRAVEASSADDLAWIDFDAGSYRVVIQQDAVLELSRCGMLNLPMGPDERFLSSVFAGYFWQFVFPR
jgi:hypothetical protein